MRHKQAHILVLSNDLGFATSIKKTLARVGYRVELGRLSEFEAIGPPERDRIFDLFVVDLAENLAAGVRFLQRMRNSCPACTVLLVSALNRDEWEALLVGRRGASILEKPLKRDVLLRKVEELLSAKVADRVDGV